MPRQRNVQHHFREIEELTRQILFLPSPQRHEHVRRAELLHDRIDPAQRYPLDFLLYRLTAEMPATPTTSVFDGRPLREDLRLLIEQVSRSAPIPISDDEPALSVEEVARRLNVSTKTVWRYRNLGLRGRWVRRPDDAHAYIAFTDEAIDHFLESHGSRARRAADFKLLTDDEKRRIIDRARRIAQQRDVSLNQVARHLAGRMHRAVQTIRQVLEQHDQRNPRDRIFIDRTGPLDPRAKRVIARAHRMGVGLAKIARRFQRTRSTIYRAIHDERAANLRRMRIPYVMSPLFSRPDADELIVWSDPQSGEAQSPAGDEPDSRKRRAATPIVADELPVALRAVYQQPTLETARTRALLVQMNYLKYRASRVRDSLDRYEPRVQDLNRIERDLAHAGAIRKRLFDAHLSVVLTTARRHLTSQSDASLPALVDLLEIGHRLLLETIDTFDIARGQTFDAYLTWTLMRRFAELPQPVRAHRRLSQTDILERMRRSLAAAGTVI